MTARNARCLRLLGLGALVGVFSCSTAPEQTQVVLDVRAEPRMERLVQNLHVIVRNTEDQIVSEATNPFLSSARIPLVPLAGDASRGYRVLVEGLAENGTVVVRAENQGRYAANEKVERQVLLADNCAFVFCGDGLSCASDGLCKPTCEVDDCIEDPRANAVFVDNVRGDDGHDCTQEASPCATLQAAMEQLSARPKRVYLIAGEPYLPLTLGLAFAGSADAPTVIQSWGDTRAVIGENNSAEQPQASLRLQNTSHVVVANLLFAGAARHAVSIESSQDIVITGSAIEDDSYAQGDASGISVDGASSNVTIAGNLIAKQRSSASLQSHAVALSGRDVRLIGNHLTESDGFGVLANGQASFEASFNRVHQNTFDGFGVFLGQPTDGIRISDNWICANRHGISTNIHIDDVFVVNNTVYANNGDGLRVFPNDTVGKAEANYNLMIDNLGAGFLVEGGALRAKHNRFVDDSVDGNVTRPSPDTNEEVARPSFVNANGCVLEHGETLTAADGSRIGAL